MHNLKITFITTMRTRCSFSIALGLVALGMFFSGCASSGHKEFYSQAAPSKYPPTQKVEIFEYQNVDLQQIYDLLYKNFLIIGTSSFNGPYEKPSTAVPFAKSIGADIFLVSTQFKETIRSSTAISTPTVNTSYVSGYSSGGSFGGTVTTYGTQTTMVPITVHRYTQHGMFLKNVNGVTPIWKRKAGDYPRDGSNQMDGLWSNDRYVLRIYQSGINSIAVIEEEQANAKDWKVGDVKFLFESESGIGLYFMGDRTPMPATFSLNKFKHLEVELILSNERFSFSRDQVK